MAEEPSHIKQLSLIHVCKIGLNDGCSTVMGRKGLTNLSARDSTKNHLLFFSSPVD
jgi:hypothetical protein